NAGAGALPRPVTLPIGPACALDGGVVGIAPAPMPCCPMPLIPAIPPGGPPIIGAPPPPPAPPPARPPKPPLPPPRPPDGPPIPPIPRPDRIGGMPPMEGIPIPPPMPPPIPPPLPPIRPSRRPLDAPFCKWFGLVLDERRHILRDQLALLGYELVQFLDHVVGLRPA